MYIYKTEMTYDYMVTSMQIKGAFVVTFRKEQ